MVTSSEVPSICLICWTTPASCVLKERRIANADDSMCIFPSLLATNRLSDPVQMQAISSCNTRQRCDQRLPGFVRSNSRTHTEDGGATVGNLDCRHLKEIESLLLRRELADNNFYKRAYRTEVRAISLSPRHQAVFNVGNVLSVDTGG